MARIGTPLLGLGTWLDNENPGAGSQTVPNTGLNGNCLIIDVAVGTGHNADGSHKANIIKGSNLVQAGGDSVVDGTTLEFNANKIRVKALAINGTHLNQTAGQTVDGATLEFNTNAIRVKALGIAAPQIAADAIITTKILNANVTTEKLEYKEYVGFLSQAGTAAPSVTEIKNTLGVACTPARTAAGIYTLTFAAALSSQGKCFVMVASPSTLLVSFINAKWTSNSVITITTWNSASVAIDAVLDVSCIIIRVYP